MRRGRRYYLPDPDTYSEKLQELYGKLWKEETLRYCKDNQDRIHGDTMNSIQKTLNWYVRICYDNHENYYAGPVGNGFVNKKGKKLNGSISQTLQIFQCEKEKEKGFLKVEANKFCVESLEEFIEYNHTLGNFIPVPFQSDGGSFNAPRAATTNDFWDLTLYHIYCWYNKNEDMENEKLKHSEAKELWKKRLENNKCEDIGACEQYLKNAKMCIEKRTKSIIPLIKCERWS